jgi:hypothetical protein
MVKELNTQDGRTAVMFVKAFAFLMILPILGILVFYGAGILLIETARERHAAQPQK